MAPAARLAGTTACGATTRRPRRPVPPRSSRRRRRARRPRGPARGRRPWTRPACWRSCRLCTTRTPRVTGATPLRGLPGRWACAPAGRCLWTWRWLCAGRPGRCQRRRRGWSSTCGSEPRRVSARRRRDPRWPPSGRRRLCPRPLLAPTAGSPLLRPGLRQMRLQASAPAGRAPGATPLWRLTEAPASRGKGRCPSSRCVKPLTRLTCFCRRRPCRARWTLPPPAAGARATLPPPPLPPLPPPSEAAQPAPPPTAPHADTARCGPTRWTPSRPVPPLSRCGPPWTPPPGAQIGSGRGPARWSGTSRRQRTRRST
mmetsp:Transcript_12821/g.49114  ORF Transcript_12821/g.49114 Transcript_12821/m.49114 type:complete len:314 (+) Transcript_12821:1708-2649(+)